MPENNAATESGNFSAEERAAMKKRAAELRAEGKKGAKKADGLQEVLGSIAEMAPQPPRQRPHRPGARPYGPADAQLAEGAPADIVEAERDLFQMFRDDGTALLTDVARTAGRPPGTFEQWCRRNAAAFH